MKRIYIYLLLLICSFSSYCYGQNAVKIKLLYKSTDAQQSNKDTLDIRRVRAAFFSDSIVVRLKNTQKLVLPPDAIWGYQDNDNTIYRYYDGDFYMVRQLDTLVIYSRRVGKSTCYYFSQGRNGELLSLNCKNLKKEFSGDTCFLDKMDNGLKWYQDYSSYDDKTKSYRMIEFFKSCTGNIQSDKAEN